MDMPMKQMTVLVFTCNKAADVGIYLSGNL